MYAPPTKYFVCAPPSEIPGTISPDLIISAWYSAFGQANER